MLLRKISKYSDWFLIFEKTVKQPFWSSIYIFFFISEIDLKLFKVCFNLYDAFLQNFLKILGQVRYSQWLCDTKLFTKISDFSKNAFENIILKTERQQHLKNIR